MPLTILGCTSDPDLGVPRCVLTIAQCIATESAGHRRNLASIDPYSVCARTDHIQIDPCRSTRHEAWPQGGQLAQ